MTKIIFLLFLTLASRGAFAQTAHIVFQNESEVSGELVSIVVGEYYELRLASGKVVRYPYADVRSIDIGSASPMPSPRPAPAQEPPPRYSFEETVEEEEVAPAPRTSTPPTRPRPSHSIERLNGGWYEVDGMRTARADAIRLLAADAGSAPYLRKMRAFSAASGTLSIAATALSTTGLMLTIFQTPYSSPGCVDTSTGPVCWDGGWNSTPAIALGLSAVGLACVALPLGFTSGKHEKDAVEHYGSLRLGLRPSSSGTQLVAALQF